MQRKGLLFISIILLGSLNACSTVVLISKTRVEWRSEQLPVRTLNVTIDRAAAVTEGDVRASLKFFPSLGRPLPQLGSLETDAIGTSVMIAVSAQSSGRRIRSYDVVVVFPPETDAAGVVNFGAMGSAHQLLAIPGSSDVIDGPVVQPLRVYPGITATSFIEIEVPRASPERITGWVELFEKSSNENDPIDPIRLPFRIETEQKTGIYSALATIPYTVKVEVPASSDGDTDQYKEVPKTRIDGIASVGTYTLQEISDEAPRHKQISRQPRSTGGTPRQPVESHR